MAFNMKPGRAPFLQTGNGLPSAFLQEKKPTQNAISGKKTQEELKAEARKIAQDKANAKLQKDIESKPLGGSTDIRTVTESADYVVPGQKPTKLVDPKDKKAYTAWLNASEENKAKFKDKKFTEQASATAAGMDKPQITTKPELTTTPPKNPVSGSPSRTIYSTEGTRGYTGTDQTGTRGLVTLNKARAEREIQFAEKMNSIANKKYAQATEGSEAARGLTGKALEKRNVKAEEMRQRLQRTMPTIKTTEADKKDAVNAANAMNRANWESNIAKNKAEGIDRVVFQKKSENKKASMKRSPAKQMKAKKKAPAKMKKY